MSTMKTLIAFLRNEPFKLLRWSAELTGSQIKNWMKIKEELYYIAMYNVM